MVNVCCNSGYAQVNNAPFDLNFNLNTGSGYAPFKVYDSSPYPNTEPGAIVTLTGSFTAGSTLGFQVVDALTAPGGNDFAIGNIVVAPAPEPATWAMMIIGVAMIGLAARRRSPSVTDAA